MQVSYKSVLSTIQFLVDDLERFASRSVFSSLDFFEIYYSRCKHQLHGIELVFLAQNGLDSSMVLTALAAANVSVDLILSSYVPKVQADDLPQTPAVSSAAPSVAGVALVSDITLFGQVLSESLDKGDFIQCVNHKDDALFCDCDLCTAPRLLPDAEIVIEEAFSDLPYEAAVDLCSSHPMPTGCFDCPLVGLPSCIAVREDTPFADVSRFLSLRAGIKGITHA